MPGAAGAPVADRLPYLFRDQAEHQDGERVVALQAERVERGHHALPAQPGSEDVPRDGPDGIAVAVDAHRHGKR